MAKKGRSKSNKVAKALAQIDLANQGERKTWGHCRHQVVEPKKGGKYNRSARKKADRKYLGGK